MSKYTITDNGTKIEVLNSGDVADYDIYLDDAYDRFQSDISKYCAANNALHWVWSGPSYKSRAELWMAANEAEKQGKTAVVMEGLS